MQNSHFRLSPPIFALVAIAATTIAATETASTAPPNAGAARAASPCITQATAPPAITETVTCSQDAISRFFLASPAMNSIAASQRAEVASHPLRYAFAYMGADAVNRLQQGFTDQAVKQIDYQAILTTTDATGAVLSHKMFGVRMDRAIAQKTDWANLEPNQLFKLAPSHLSHWLQSGIGAEDVKPK